MRYSAHEMSRAARDDFPDRVKRDLCDRVGALCSRPDCRIFTKGPRADSAKAKSIGRAAHIHAAAEQGPRYNPNQTHEERRSFDNGIWLCANHAGEVDDDKSRFSADELRRWKRQAEESAHARIGRSAITAGGAAVSGLIAIGPDVILRGRVLRTTQGIWTIGVDGFVLGDIAAVHRFADSFPELTPDNCFVCIAADGIGRMLVEGPTTDLTSGVAIELHLSSPLPLDEARKKFDANLRGSDIAMDLSSDEPDIDPMLREVSGVDTIPQSLMAHLSTCKGGWCIGGEAGSRVAELHHKLGREHVANIVVLETIRLATVPHHDSLLNRPYVPFDFIERVRGARLLPTTSADFLKVALSLDVYGIQGTKEFDVPISTSIEHLGPPPDLSFIPMP